MRLPIIVIGLVGCVVDRSNQNEREASKSVENVPRGALDAGK